MIAIRKQKLQKSTIGKYHNVEYNTPTSLFIPTLLNQLIPTVLEASFISLHSWTVF